MTQQGMSMEARLERMERRCRRLTAGVIALAAVLATACLSSAMRGAPDVLRAKRIEVLRDDGAPGILMVGDVHVPNESVTGAGIWLMASDGDAISCWTNGRIRDDEDGIWRSCTEFSIESGSAQVNLWTNDRQGGVKVYGGSRRAALEADAKRTSLRFFDIDPKAEEEEGDPLRVSLEVVDGIPALKATNSDGETAFEQP